MKAGMMTKYVTPITSPSPPKNVLFCQLNAQWYFFDPMQEPIAQRLIIEALAMYDFYKCHSLLSNIFIFVNHRMSMIQHGGNAANFGSFSRCCGMESCHQYRQYSMRNYIPSTQTAYKIFL